MFVQQKLIKYNNYDKLHVLVLIFTNFYTDMINDNNEKRRFLILTGLTLEGRNIVNFNEPINLTCLVRGENRAPEDVDWFFNGVKIVPGSSRWRNRVYITRERETYKKEFKSHLLIDNSDFSDRGVFVCRASADLVESISVSVLECKDDRKSFFIRILSY